MNNSQIVSFEVTEGELLEIMTRSASQETLKRLNRVRSQMADLARQEAELLESLQRDRLRLDQLERRNQLNRDITRTITYDAMARRRF
jgi:hypothetical protein